MANGKSEAARKVDQQRSQSLGISKHAELAAFFCFGKSDAEEGGSSQPFLFPFPLTKPLGLGH
jgi:hypothetical protein